MSTTTKSKTLCPGSGTKANDVRTMSDIVFAMCPTCTRVLKPTAVGAFREHQPRGETTRSMDTTRDQLWMYSVKPAGQDNPHVAIGLAVRVRHGAVPTGFKDMVNADLREFEDLWGRWGSITDVGETGCFETLGWYWNPQDLTRD